MVPTSHWFAIAMIAWFIVAGFDVWYIEKSNRYYRKKSQKKEVRPMNKKENRMAVRQTVEKAVLRDEQNQRIQFAAANPVQEVLKSLHTTLRGLDAETVTVSRTKYGSNKVTHEKKHVWQVLLSIHLRRFCSVWLWYPL